MRKYYLLAIFLLCALLLAGCAPQQRAEDFPLPNNFALPEKHIYGFGEATHGSAEFTLARQNIFAYLVQEHGVRAFCLEVNFSEGQKINTLLHGSTWNAVQAAQELSAFAYRHNEMASLLQWIRDYNASVSPDEQIRFYGFDCDQWRDGSIWLEAYLQRVSPEIAVDFSQTPLSTLRNKSRYAIEEETLSLCLNTMLALAEKMESNQQQYVAISSEEEYDIALQTAKSLQHCILLWQADADVRKLYREDLSEEEQTYILEQSIAAGNLRDTYMAEHIAWILEHEQKYYGRDAVFITGHNGHIMRENYHEAVRLGELLAMEYADHYYAIGSDFGSGQFQAENMKRPGSLKKFEVGEGSLAAYFKDTEGAVAFVEFASMHETEKEVFTRPQKLHTVGGAFSGEMQAAPDSYLMELTPSECYDALLYIKSIHAFQPYPYR